VKYVLAKRHRQSLTAFARSNVLLAFDFDGTLAPIAEQPQRARMRRSTRRLLARASMSYPCIVISGRALGDIAERVKDVPLWTVLGNHGVEPWGRSPMLARRVAEWRRRLEPRLARHAGVVLEDKRYSITLHYRQAPDKAAARRAIRAALAGINGARVFGGKRAVNVVPRAAPDKGAALDRARHLAGCDRMIYVGDDRTDEDAFRRAPQRRLLSIRIGRARRTGATYYLRTQVEIDALLATLIRLRAG